MISLLWKAINYFVFLHPLLYELHINRGGDCCSTFAGRGKNRAFPPLTTARSFPSLFPPIDRGRKRSGTRWLIWRRSTIPVTRPSWSMTAAPTERGGFRDELSKKYGAWLRVVHLRPNSEGKARAVRHRHTGQQRAIQFGHERGQLSRPGRAQMDGVPFSHLSAGGGGYRRPPGLLIKTAC